MPENAHENSSRCAAATTRPTTTNASWRWLNVAPDLISKSVEKDPAKKQELPDNQWAPGDQILMRKWKSSRPVKKTKVRSHVSTFFLSETRDAAAVAGFVPCVATEPLPIYVVLLLSLYFNGPPPDETFRFHRLLQSVESVELPIDYFSPSILERQQSSRLLYHQSRRRLVVIIVVGGSATNLPTSVFANRNFKVANGDLF